MANEKKAPAALHHEVVKTLLDRLGDDKETEFRALFARDPQAALVQAGYTAPGECLALRSGATLAPAAHIRRDRQRLEQSLSSVFGFTFDCPPELKG